DSVMLQPMVTAIPAVRSRRGSCRCRPGRLRADKGYDSPVHRRWLRARGIVPRIARRGVDSSERLGRYRWKIERTLAWLSGYRRLTMRYERRGEYIAAFLQLAAALTCFKKLAK
ncbi:transposase, partial [Rhodococcus sp. HS-D2]